MFFIVIATKEDNLFHSAYFRHEYKVHVTQQSWVASFVLEFVQYCQGIEELRTVYFQLADEYKKLDNPQVLENDTDSVSTQVYPTLLQQQTQKYEQLEVNG